MILVLKKDIRQEEMNNLITWLESQNVRTHISNGEYKTVVGLVGDTSALDIDLISGLDIVESVTRITEPFKKANRKFHPDRHALVSGSGRRCNGRRPLPGHRRALLGREPPSRSICVADAVKRPRRHTSCAAARSSPALPPTLSRGLHDDGHRTTAGGARTDRYCPSSPRS